MKSSNRPARTVLEQVTGKEVRKSTGREVRKESGGKIIGKLSSGKEVPERAGKYWKVKRKSTGREVFCESHKQTVEIIGESKI